MSAVLMGFLPKMHAGARFGAAIRILRVFRGAATGMANFVLERRLHQFKTTARFPHVG
jgi:hypothetical protein